MKAHSFPAVMKRTPICRTFLVTSCALPNPPVPSYVAVDARLAWTVSRGVELSLAGFNLFDRSHPEFNAAPARSEVARSFALKLRWDL